MIFFYVATPYSLFPGGLNAAHDAACQMTARLIDQGWPVFSPIAHTHHVSHYMRHDPRDAAFWIKVNRGPMEAAAGIIIATMPGWGQSEGVLLEREFFERLGRPVLEMNPDGVFFSNGPGDPEPLEYAVENVKQLQGKKPIFGICLGHQIFGIALGGKTYKLKFGHHGGNHPIMNHRTGKVEITAQNHNFNVDPDSLPDDVERTHTNLNDQTLAGLRHKTDPMFSVQYHPEASPGPHDSHYLFKDFRKMMEEWKK